MMRDQRRQLRLEESRQKKEKQKNDRVLQTFKNAVEVATPRGSMLISPSQKSLAQLESESPPPTHLSSTPLSSWCYPATTVPSTSSQHFAGQTPTSDNPLSHSEQHSVSRGIPTPELKMKYYSEVNLSFSEVPIDSQYNFASSEFDTGSNVQPSDMATSYRILPVGSRNFTHRLHFQLSGDHNPIVSTHQKLTLKVAKKKR